MRLSRSITVLSLLFASSLVAEDGPTEQAPSEQRNWSGTVGLGVSQGPAYAGAEEERVRALPVFGLEYRQRFFLGATPGGVGFGLGAHLARTEAWTWTASLGLGDRRPESRGDALAGMGDRGYGLHAGTSVGYRRGLFHASLGVNKGFNGGAGWAATLSGGLSTRPREGWTAGLGASATFADRDQMQFEFGIDADQARRRQELIAAGDPRLRAGEAGPYFPDAGLESVGLSASLGYAFSRRLLLRGSLGFLRFVGDAADSPLVRESDQLRSGLALAYRW